MVTLAAKHVTHSEVYAGGVIEPHGSVWLGHQLKEAGLGAS
jgi:hypothetical protein